MHGHSSFCDSCLNILARERLDDNDRVVLYAIYDGLLEASAREGLVGGRVSTSYKGLTNKELGERSELSRHYVRRSVTRLLAFNLIVTIPEGRKILHQLSPEGYRVCRLLFGA